MNMKSFTGFFSQVPETASSFLIHALQRTRQTRLEVGFARAGRLWRLVLGTQMYSAHQEAKVIDVNKRNGDLVWITTLDDHPAAVITQSAVASGDRVYLGVSSDEESLATASNYPCCSFRGSILALNISDGSIVWKTSTVPEGKGFSGVAVWGSTPVLEPERRTVYITTGNNYTVPQQVLDCSSAGGSPEEIKACVNGVDGS